MRRLLLSLLPLLLASGALAEDVHHDGELAIGYLQAGEVFEIGANTVYFQNGDIGVVGTGTLLIDGTLRLTGQLWVSDNATVIVDGGELHIDGHDTHIYVSEDARIIFRNNAFLHYVQFYVAQHNIFAWGNGHVELHDTTVDCDGSIEFIYLRENSSYQALNVHYRHWKTWYLWDDALLDLENINLGGDIVFYDRPTMRFRNVNVIMPWLYFGDGAVVDFEFPKPQNPEDPVSVVFDSSLEGVSGIPWSLTIEDCPYIAWGVNPYPGSDVTIRNSDLTMAMFRFASGGVYDLEGLMVAESDYADETIPVDDRHFRLVNTHVKWWKVDVENESVLNAEGIVFSEMVVRDQATANLGNSICEGQTIHLGVLDDAYAHSKDGEVWSYVSIWQDATLVLENSLVDWQKGEESHGFIYQTENIAHGNSRLYCINSTLRDPPQAFDSAVVMFAAIDPPEPAKVGDTLDITGSAWLEAGEESPVTFSKYQLFHAPKGSKDWTLVSESETQVEAGTLATWDTNTLESGGAHQLKLVILADHEETNHETRDHPALGTITLELEEQPADGGCGCGVFRGLYDPLEGLYVLLAALVPLYLRRRNG